MKRPLISVIIPTWQEASTIDACLNALIDQAPHEILVVDAGSPDGTASIACRPGVQVLNSRPGRSFQQNHGAGQASGDVFLFLHADCRLSAGALNEIALHVQRNPRSPGGCLRMRVEDERFLCRCIEAAAHLRAGILGLPYGDQAIFLTRKGFHRINGFPRVRFLEDVFLGVNVRRIGRMSLLSSQVYVSARRWQRVGLLRQTLLNWSLTALGALGVSPDRLSRCYRAIR